MDTIMWENLHRIFVLLRYDIKNKNNWKVVDILIKVIKDDASNESMCKLIVNVIPNWYEQLKIKGGSNNELFDNRNLKLYIIKALELLKNKILSQEYEMAYDIADMLQGLPDLKILNKKRKFRQYWKLYIRPFQKKWKLNIFNQFK